MRSLNLDGPAGRVDRDGRNGRLGLDHSSPLDPNASPFEKFRRLIYRLWHAFLSVLLACLLSVVTVMMAALGTLQTTAPEAVSLLLEPFSLLLVPGVLAAMVWVNIVAHATHHGSDKPEVRDFTTREVLLLTFLFYLVLYCLLLRWRARRRDRLLSLESSSR